MNTHAYRCNPIHCRSEPAREKPENAAGRQAPSVIVDHHREQARSYRGFAVGAHVVYDIDHTVGGVARDGGFSVDINAECAAVIASKLAPTGGLSDSGLSGDINVGRTAVIASKLAPTGGRV